MAAWHGPARIGDHSATIPSSISTQSLRSQPVPTRSSTRSGTALIGNIWLDETKVSIMNNELVARICHEVNRAWCEFNGDTSQPSWGDAPEWQRLSAINGVRFHRANPDAGDSASHDSWMAE